MTLRSQLLLSGLLAGAGAAASTDSSICAFAPEGQSATLTCPRGTVIDAITTATFGEFAANSSCAAAALRPTALCPTTVAAQTTLLCRKRETCAVFCGCDADATPPCSCQLTGAAASTVARAAPSASGIPLCVVRTLTAAG